MKHWKSCECRKCERNRTEKLRAENERLREALRQIITHQSLLTELADEQSQFAEHLEQASRIVQSWPVWKQSVLGNIDPRKIYQPETTTPARQSSTGESETSATKTGASIIAREALEGGQ